MRRDDPSTLVRPFGLSTLLKDYVYSGTATRSTRSTGLRDFIRLRASVYVYQLRRDKTPRQAGGEADE